jgi:5-methylcytosine-specific restriction endonuclease McrA
MKKKATKLHSLQELARAGGVCEKCREVCPYLTVDHIIPISILEMLDEKGDAKYEWEDNFQLLCRICNVYKANRLDKRNPKTMKLLLELINK